MGPITKIRTTAHLSTLAIGLGIFAGSAYAITPTETVKLISSDKENIEDLMGISINGSGDRIIFGASGDDTIDFSAGSAFVYRLDGSTWTEEGKLVASDGGIFDRFGSEVHIMGDWAVVGAPARRPEPTPQSPQTGAAYIFHFDGAVWSEHTMLLPDTASREHMGGSVVLDGNTLAIGATTTAGKGAVYMYEFDGTNWVSTQKIIAPDGVFEDTFGGEISITNGKMVVSAHSHDSNGRDAGAVYVFAYDGSTWNFEAKLVANDGQEEDWFGFAVDMDGDRIIVGASRHDEGIASNNGAAYVFDFDGTSWSQTAKLLPDDTAQFDYFGFSVSIDGDLIAVGAESQNNANGFGAGSVYLFEFDGAIWSQEFKILASDGANQDSFGYDARLSEGRLLVGAPFHDEFFDESGAVYVFDLNQTCSAADFAEPFDELNFFDVSAFLSALNAGDLTADLNGDGMLNFFDISEFLIAFGDGCP